MVAVHVPLMGVIFVGVGSLVDRDFRNGSDLDFTVITLSILDLSAERSPVLDLPVTELPVLGWSVSVLPVLDCSGPKVLY